MIIAAQTPCLLRSVLATLAMVVLLSPLAVARFGAAGLGLVLLFAALIIVSQWIAARGAAALARRDHLLAGLFITSGVRMILPLALALGVVLAPTRLIPAEAAVLVVPLYLAMLAADIWDWIRRGAITNPRPAASPSSAGVLG
jgi:hypothetical protein